MAVMSAVAMVVWSVALSVVVMACWKAVHWVEPLVVGKVAWKVDRKAALLECSLVVV